MKKWILGLLAVLALGGLMLFVDGDALARARALEEGTAEQRTAELHVHRDRNRYSRTDKYDLEASFADPDSGKTIDPRFEVVDMEGFAGMRLQELSGEEVTVHLYEGEVIAIELPDGELIKGDNVGWRGLGLHWSLAVLGLGIALLAGGIFFELAGTGSVGVAMVALGGLGFLFITWPWVALLAAALVVGLLGWLVWNELTRKRRGADEDEADSRKARRD